MQYRTEQYIGRISLLLIIKIFFTSEVSLGQTSSLIQTEQKFAQAKFQKKINKNAI